jgi:hypothetical protein
MNMKQLALLLSLVVTSTTQTSLLGFNAFLCTSAALSLGIYIPCIVTNQLENSYPELENQWCMGRHTNSITYNIAQELKGFSRTLVCYVLPVFSSMVLYKNWNNLNRSQKIFLFITMLPSIPELQKEYFKKQN